MISSHARPLKRRTSSIKRENDRTKKTFFEEAIYEQSTEREFKSVSNKKPSEKLFYSIHKAIDCTPKVKDVKTIENAVKLKPLLS